MSLRDRMESTLRAQFAPTALQVTDDSAHHAGHAGAPAGGESHFTVEIASAAFAGLSPVACHRAIYAACQPFFAEGLHALAIKARAD